MNTIASLEEKVKELKSQLEPLEKQLRELYRAKEIEIGKKVDECYRMNTKFEPGELVYSAHARCKCGLGLAYPHGIGVHGAWHCSGILTGTADLNVVHEKGFMFSFYEIKSENQPSANGATTRPTTIQ